MCLPPAPPPLHPEKTNLYLILKREPFCYVIIQRQVGPLLCIWPGLNILLRADTQWINLHHPTQWHENEPHPTAFASHPASSLPLPLLDNLRYFASLRVRSPAEHRRHGLIKTKFNSKPTSHGFKKKNPSSIIHRAPRVESMFLSVLVLGHSKGKNP